MWISTGAYTVITTTVTEIGKLEASPIHQIPGDHLWHKIPMLTSILVASIVAIDCQDKRVWVSKSVKQVLDAAIINAHASDYNKFLTGDYIATMPGEKVILRREVVHTRVIFFSVAD